MQVLLPQRTEFVDDQNKTFTCDIFTRLSDQTSEFAIAILFVGPENREKMSMEESKKSKNQDSKRNLSVESEEFC